MSWININDERPLGGYVYCVILEDEYCHIEELLYKEGKFLADTAYEPEFIASEISHVTHWCKNIDFLLPDGMSVCMSGDLDYFIPEVP